MRRNVQIICIAAAAVVAGGTLWAVASSGMLGRFGLNSLVPAKEASVDPRGVSEKIAAASMPKVPSASRRSAEPLAIEIAEIAAGGASVIAGRSPPNHWVAVLANGREIATTVATDVTAGNITDSPTVNGNPTSVLVRTTGVGYATEPVLSAARANFNESSVRDNVYFTFSVAANAGNELDLSSLTFNVARGGAATPRDYDIRTSLDGFATSLTGIVAINTARPTFTAVSVDLSAAQFQNLTSPMTFQFRFFTAGVSQNVDFDDITLNGAVVAVPEPNTLAVLAIAGGWMFRRRRREVT